MLDIYRIPDDEIVPFDDGAVDIGLISEDSPWLKDKIGEIELAEYEILENAFALFDEGSCKLSFFEDCRLFSSATRSLFTHMKRYVDQEEDLTEYQYRTYDNVINVLEEAVKVGSGIIAICD